MRISHLIFLAAILISGCTSCEDDELVTPTCGEFIQIVDAPPASADIPHGVEASVDGMCLSITVGYSGCSSDPWTMELYTNGDIAESLPTQSIAHFVFNDAAPGEDQLCLAVFSKTFEFDLTPYLDNALPSILRIDGTEIELLVE